MTVEAGAFREWLVGMMATLAGDADSAVPCGSCTACCHASQFIHIAPDETDALAHIPQQLLFPAPRAPQGHVLMGYDREGRCPMLVDGRCTIYAHRPRTCRTYDCRVFPAAGLSADDPEIAERARQWRFTSTDPGDAALRSAVRAAAEFVATRRAKLPEDVRAMTATQHAVAAVRLHALFVGNTPTVESVRVALTRRVAR